MGEYWARMGVLAGGRGGFRPSEKRASMGLLDTRVRDQWGSRWAQPPRHCKSTGWSRAGGGNPGHWVCSFLFSFCLRAGQRPEIPLSLCRALGLLEQPNQGSHGHLHGSHDHTALLQEVPILRLPLSDEPLGNGTERLQVDHTDGRGGVGQGEHSKHIAREPAERARGWVITGKGSQGSSNCADVYTMGHAAPDWPLVGVEGRWPAGCLPKTLRCGCSWGHQAPGWPLGLLLTRCFPGPPCCCGRCRQCSGASASGCILGKWVEKVSQGGLVLGCGREGGSVIRHNLGGRAWM